MGELRSPEEASQAWTKLFVVTLGSSHVLLLFGTQCGLSILYEFSPCMLTCVRLPTEAGRQTSPDGTALRMKQAEEEEERLLRELKLVTEETNELRDRLIYATEGAMNKRYALLQTLRCQPWA